MKCYLSIFIALVFAACRPNTTSPTEAFVKRVEAAHQKADFLSKAAVRYDLQITFMGSPYLDAQITMTTNSSKARIDKKDGHSLVYDGSAIYQSPDSVEQRGARFDMFTWTYFFALPYKLDDPGTHWEIYGDSNLNDEVYDAGKLTFASGTGDSPDDWYVVYADTKTQRIHAAAYIVTMGQSLDEAEKDPHAIEYLAYENVDGIPIATEWKFWEWRAGQGLTRELGSGRVSNVQFIALDNDLFVAPENSLVVQ